MRGSPPHQIDLTKARDVAGTGSFSVTAGGGCNWTAVSQNSWITVTSGANGTSNGTVGFSVAANTSTAPLVGNIQVGNGTSSALFTVNEGGACYYNLSEGPVFAVPPSGTTSTVQVSTSTDCPWTATSNAAWLAITSGSSGTGSGSFTWTAAPNTGSSDRIGTITVMNQTITVVDGAPVGTPGQGTVTISGAPQLGFYNGCQYPRYCKTWAYESGSVSIAVGGVTVGTSYGQSSDTAASLASKLAAAINAIQNTPVFAVASGATITITSVLNGAGTNYPLAAWATFNPYLGGSVYFTAPAFTGTSSGPNLTGGTN